MGVYETGHHNLAGSVYPSAVTGMSFGEILGLPAVCTHECNPLAFNTQITIVIGPLAIPGIHRQNDAVAYQNIHIGAIVTAKIINPTVQSGVIA